MLNLDREFEEIKELIDYLKKSCPYQDIESKTASLGLEREINFYLDQKDLEKMKEMGMSIGSHGVSHFLFSRLDDIIKESSQDKFLEELNKKEIISFAYPFGDPISFNEAANSVLKKKYQYICTTIPSINKNKNGVMGRVCSYEMSPIKLYLKLMIGY
jgi:FAD synthase